MIESVIGELEQKAETSQKYEIPPYFCEKLVAIFPLLLAENRADLIVRYKRLCEIYNEKIQPIIENEKKFFPHHYIGV